ncbi:MAG TPA: hypothetical protein VNA24_01000 [Hyalangium sp.]|jgi:hypothetical protein|nr:hypothetical protein [Hyalangium sp.]
MRSITPTRRGMALIMAMIVIVLITMLVAGAISFTGTELAASEVQMQESSMSACIQAARNLFLSRLQANPDAVPCPSGLAGQSCLNVSFNETFQSPANPSVGHQLTTGHLGELTVLSARQASALTDPMKLQRDDSNGPKNPRGARAFYVVTAVCRDNTAPGAPEREIEFMVRTDL